MTSIDELASSRDSDRQVIKILVSDGYHPDVIQAQAGRPIRLVFRRQDDRACSDRVVFSRAWVSTAISRRGP